ncbi:helix-turn-helix transcriptional regulator [Xanthomonas campestris pv. campestris]|nr:helix-turn-helix transcriptional regulator [Xanthomonas campestris pv. campestris]MEB2052675.1 helix-turn-helix transcriptional regulator [Xanthomonas campestris pv. campestris]
MDLAANFGAAVRRQRELLRLSQEDLADRSGLDRTYISGVERGVRNPTLQVMQKLADALGSDLDVLFATARQCATAMERPDALRP